MNTLGIIYIIQGLLAKTGIDKVSNKFSNLLSCLLKLLNNVKNEQDIICDNEQLLSQMSYDYWVEQDSINNKRNREKQSYLELINFECIQEMLNVGMITETSMMYKATTVDSYVFEKIVKEHISGKRKTVNKIETTAAGNYKETHAFDVVEDEAYSLSIYKTILDEHTKEVEDYQKSKSRIMLRENYSRRYEQSMREYDIVLREQKCLSELKTAEKRLEKAKRHGVEDKQKQENYDNAFKSLSLALINSEMFLKKRTEEIIKEKTNNKSIDTSLSTVSL